MKKFTIDASGIVITPPDVAKLVAETFQSAYADRGSDETPEEHLTRKVEEFILNTFRSRHAEDSAHAVRSQMVTEISEAASIRQRKDKAPEEAEEDGPPAMPALESAKPKPRKR